MKSALILRSAPLIAALAVAGCVNYSGLHPHASINSGNDLNLSAGAQAWPEQHWWDSYHDPVLTGLIQQALSQNPGMKLAEARLAKAASMAQMADAGAYPVAAINASVMPEHFTENYIYPPPFAGKVYSTNMLMVNAKYEFDFWGKNRAALNAALSSEKAAQAEIQSAAIILTTSVAKSYFALARAGEQKKILQTTLKQRQELTKVTQQRLLAGLDTSQDMHLSKQGIPAIEADIIRLDEQISLTRNALAALTGQGPTTTVNLEATLPPGVSLTIPEQVPAELIGRRADISAARSRVEAALGQIAVAKTEFYPNVNLSAFAGFSSLGFTHWLDGSSRDYGVGPAISLPIFDGGRLRANLSSKNADYDIAVESYNQTLIEAVHDVADQLSFMRSLSQQQVQQAELQRDAESVYELAQKREQAGLISHVSVLNAQTNVLSQQSAALDLRARALELTMNLNRALGGGFHEQKPHSEF